MQDIEKWRARESTWVNFSVFYWYKIFAGVFYYKVRPMPQAPAVTMLAYWCMESGGGCWWREPRCMETDALSKPQQAMLPVLLHLAHPG